jgi:hypothetical protein
MKNTLALIVTLGLGASVLSGCAADGRDAGGVSDTDSSGHGTVVARVQLTATHYVEFMEFKEGFVSLIESRNADLNQAAPEAVKFDPQQKTCVALYKELLARAEFPDASDEKADLERLAAVDATFAALQKTVKPNVPEEGAIGTATQALTHRWGNYNTTTGDWTWFSTNFCRSWTDFCEVGWLGSHTQTATSKSASMLLFNEHATSDYAQLRLAWDPCKDALPWDFCTSPYKTLTTLTAPHRYVSQSTTWSNKDHTAIDWAVWGDGTHYGWALTFDN